MPYCPSCGYEFQKGITTCPDCKVPLLDKLPETNGTSEESEKWVVVRRVSIMGEGKIIRGLLIANNIPAVVEDSSFGMIPESMGDLSVIKVMVREQDKGAAEALLKDQEESVAEEDVSED
ncbi:MAG: DUF2007 domain-containing protein [Acidobacteria bacterium]|nr:DUF2007 domain-containing protein [Acidobacteriota bacterium]